MLYFVPLRWAGAAPGTTTALVVDATSASAALDRANTVAFGSRFHADLTTITPAHPRLKIEGVYVLRAKGWRLDHTIPASRPS